MPVLRFLDNDITEAATKLTQSITLRFFLAILRHARAIRRELRSGSWSIELRRIEYALLPALLRTPFIQMLHGGEISPTQPMDSLLRRYWFLQGINERISLTLCQRFLCVSPIITERLRNTWPQYRHKIDTLTTWANTDIYRPQPFTSDNSSFRVIYCGRLDKFKMPSLMFNTIARLRELIGNVEFHYVGTSNPSRFAEFEAIRPISTIHGYQDADGIARIMARVDAGILTSEFEGMPRFVLETLSCGRPVAAIHLPQLESVIEAGKSGYLAPRLDDPMKQADQLARAFVALRQDIRSGRIDPTIVRSKIESFTPDKLLGRMYQYHRDIQNARQPRLS
jgi:glycosyltransferase involved in cell wall biosynthesis